MLQPTRFAMQAVAAGRIRLTLLALLTGAVAALGQAPFGLWPVSVLAFAAVFDLFRASSSTRLAAYLGWIFGTGYFAVSLNWIVEPFLVDPVRHGWMAPFAITFLSTGLALFWALSFGLARALGGSAWVFAATLILTEAARGVLFTGFPWAQPGHIWIDTPLLQLAAYIGALGLIGVTLTLSLLLWRAFVSGYVQTAIMGALLLAIPVLPLLPAEQAQQQDAPIIRLIQPNAPQHEKWDPAMIPTFFNRQMDYTRATPTPDLVVWPETSIPVDLGTAQPTLREMSRASRGTPIVVGAQRLNGVRRYNSLALLGSDGQISALYDKHHLVPFGEYIPYGDFFARFGLRGMAANDGNGFSAGPGPVVIDIPDLGTALPLICYEGVFPYDLANAPERADFILLITNDAWFGEFSGPYQHFAQARLRSVEQGLPMIRVANTGISAMIDAQGRVTASLPLGQAGYLDAALPPPIAPTVYARMGDLPILLLMTAVVAGAVALRRRQTEVSD